MPDLITPRPGQVWKENNRFAVRFVRIEEIAEHVSGQRVVTMKTVSRIGDGWAPRYAAPLSWTSANRFNGEDGGFSLEEDINVVA